MEKKQKIVNIDLQALKDAAADKAKGAVSTVGARIGAVKDKAVAGILDKGIALTEKQLKALEGARGKRA
jgi:hypothetical protein